MGYLGNIFTRLGDLFGQTAPEDVDYEFDPTQDSFRDYLVDDIKFNQLRDLIRAGDSGELHTALKVFEQIEEKDARLASVASTRRLALTGLPWRVVSAADKQESIEDRTLADEMAAYVRETLSNISSFDCAMEHLALAIGPNLSVVELVWESNELVDFVPIPSWRLKTDGRTTDLRLMTRDVPAGIVMQPGKFVIHVPNARVGFRIQGSIHRTIAAIHLMKLKVFSDWGQFCQIYGMPVRVGRYQPNASAEEKSDLRKMMRDMGSNLHAILSKAVDFEMKESSQRGTSPYEAMLNYCDKQITIAMLGGHLMVDTASSTGTHAAGAVQEDVRGDLRSDDIRKEGRTVREQVIAPMIAFQFKGDVDKLGRRVPLPYFERVVPETVDYLQRAQLLEAATQRLGMAVDEDEAYGMLGLNNPERDEKTGEPVGRVVIKVSAPNPFGEEGNEPAFREEEL